MGFKASAPTSTPSWKISGAFCGLALSAVLAVAGCRSARVTQPMAPALLGSDPDSQMDYWHAVADRKLISNDEAFHGILLYVDGKDAAADYAGRVAALKARKMLPGGFHGAADEAVTRGTLAVPIVRAAKLKGGVVMSLLGPTPRYALRELQYRGLYPISSPNQLFSGTEFVGVIGKLDDFQNGEAAPPQLPAEVGADAATGGGTSTGPQAAQQREAPEAPVRPTQPTNPGQP